MPIISVVVPVYKVEKYLCRCVDSILAQTFTDFELILVDDGSPDNSGAMCDDYAAKDSRVRVIHKENGGLSDARNAGIEAAKGECLFFIDSDDMIHTDTLRILYESLTQGDAQISVGGFERFQGDTPERGQDVKWDNSKNVISSEEAMDMIFEPWKHKQNMVSSCCKLYCKDLFENVRFPLKRLFEDEFTVYKVYSKASRIAIVDMTLYFYFSNSDGITGTVTLNQWMDAYDARYEKMVFFGEYGYITLYKRALTEYLRWAQWDLIKCREGQEFVLAEKKCNFEKQFLDVFNRARKEKIINVRENIDYYLLAKPKWSMIWKSIAKIMSCGR